MGVLAPGLRTWDPPLGPPSTLAEVIRQTCLQSHLQTSPPTPQVISEVSDHICKKTTKKDLKIDPRGLGGGGPNFIFFPEFLLFFFGAKIWNPTTTPSVVLNSSGPNKKKKIKFPLTPMGVLAPGSAQRDTPLSPPSTFNIEIFRRTCLQSHLQNFRKNPKKNLKIAPRGPAGGVWILFFPNFFYFY